MTPLGCESCMCASTLSFVVQHVYACRLADWPVWRGTHNSGANIYTDNKCSEGTAYMLGAFVDG